MPQWRALICGTLLYITHVHELTFCGFACLLCHINPAHFLGVFYMFTILSLDIIHAFYHIYTYLAL